MSSCANNKDTNKSFDIKGKYTHHIIDCDNENNPEINCVEFIEFINDSTVNVLIGGGDIVFRTKYQINDNKIKLEKTVGLNFDISFNIQNETTLYRIEDRELWEKNKIK